MAPLLEGHVDSFSHRTFAQPFHRLCAHLEGLGDRGIAPLRSFGSGIGFEQDTRLRCLARGCFSVLERLSQLVFTEVEAGR